MSASRSIITILVLVVPLAGGCRCRTGMGEDHASLAGASRMARSFWLDVLRGDLGSAEKHLATGEEIRAALEGWGRVMNEPFDEATLQKEVDATYARLQARWAGIKSGKEPLPDGLDAEGIMKADTLVGNKLFIGPSVSYIQRLTLTGPGVDPAKARVAGAVRVGDGEWKILWLP
ncbi:MAG: hypothetical protein JRG91_10425 [Deltaproteobacteria bacterium]|nr:hypothetical protein [Deltaproteobacteria bacterium]